jgi:hypothetical protein
MGSYNFVRYHAFINCIYFRYLVQNIDFLLIELSTIIFTVWPETKQTRKYQGDYLVKKKHPPLPLLVGEILRFVYVFPSWLYVYVSVCSSSWSARKSFFHAQRLVNTFGESAWLEVREIYLFVAFRDCSPDIMCSCELTDYWSTVPSCSLDI